MSVDYDLDVLGISSTHTALQRNVAIMYRLQYKAVSLLAALYATSQSSEFISGKNIHTTEIENKIGLLLFDEFW